MTRAPALALALALAPSGCTSGYVEPSGRDFGPFLPSDTSNRIVISSPYGSPKGPPPVCADPAEWEVVTWPEMEPVPTTIFVSRTSRRHGSCATARGSGRSAG